VGKGYVVKRDYSKKHQFTTRVSGGMKCHCGLIRYRGGGMFADVSYYDTVTNQSGWRECTKLTTYVDARNT